MKPPQPEPKVEVIIDSDNQTPESKPGFMDRFLVSGFALSLVLHALLLIFMALIVFQIPSPEEYLSAIVEYSEDEVELLDEIPDLTELNVEVDEQQFDLVTRQISTNPGGAPELNIMRTESENGTPTVETLVKIPELDITSHLGGRSAASRSEMIKLFGGTEQSEKAVERGLKWLADRQRKDGSWSFDHRRPEDKHTDHQAGSLGNCPIGATAMALMAFLGAGHVHTEPGEYNKVVDQGLQFLISQGAEVREGIDFRGRTGADKTEVPGGNHVMYAHALAAIALCEAYGMTRDRTLRTHAQGSLEFIIRNRNREVGGWRYKPEEVGDLSVTGWMVMALKSGQTAGLRFSDIGFTTSEDLLDACQRNEGSQYGYLPGQGPKSSTSAIGLLCRMYLGWGREHPVLRQGASLLSQTGPSKENIYYNYYATQIMHHLGGNVWTAWNEDMREWLVKTQVRSGPETGSWDTTDPHSNRGGRLYQTCLSVMTLEVYYRHLPLYQVRAFGEK
ncbi:prenyltransferase/squalene oxidase repeat-containing protein [uncultured Rubinisphaera sp.]|uniref:prenyltransferase/squalene oxidase repeat-containing protein n=1 Tax=uncultured Rubinisphaera sp. TaxID=1678686 RepID=UPI0030D7E064